jgi:colanic acid/amylovoran biosynthesis glycosyltransferase
MKIAFILQVFPAVSETFILNQITGLIDKGHDVRVFAYKRGSTDVMHPEVKKYRLFERTVFLPREGKNRWLRWMKQLLLSLWLCLQNPRLLYCFRTLDSMKVFLWPDACALANYYDRPGVFDVTHVQFGNVAPNLAYLKRAGIVSGPLVVSFRGNDATVGLRARPKSYDGVFQYADMLLPVCEFIKQLLVEHGAPQDKVVVHHSGIRLIEFPFSIRQFPKDGPVRLLCVARLVEKKGVGYLLEAVSCLYKSGYNIHLDILGDGPLKTDYIKQIEQLSISKITRIHGSLAKLSVVQFLQNSHILVHPSIKGTNNEEEGIPNVIKEAMLTGLPVIATRTGGISELVEDGKSGFIIPEKNVDALVEKIIYLIEHPEIWPQIGSAGRAHVEANYDSDKLNDRLVEIYQQLISSKLDSVAFSRGH